MRALFITIALLGMAATLQAKEADRSQGLRSADASPKQSVGYYRGEPRANKQAGRDDRKDRFAAEAVVPDICTGC
jgi:hypothetical protein